jgi:hypothetical protein
MPGRSARRELKKRLVKCATLTGATVRTQAATRMLLAWRAEARRRAQHLGAPAVWALAASPRVRAIARRLDPSGELLSELRRVCAEAIAEAAGHHLVSGSRPVAERRRVKAFEQDGGIQE